MAFCVLRSAFCVLRSAFCVLRSAKFYFAGALTCQSQSGKCRFSDCAELKGWRMIDNQGRIGHNYQSSGPKRLDGMTLERQPPAITDRSSERTDSVMTCLFSLPWNGMDSYILAQLLCAEHQPQNGRDGQGGAP